MGVESFQDFKHNENYGKRPMTLPDMPRFLSSHYTYKGLTELECVLPVPGICFISGTPMGPSLIIFYSIFIALIYTQNNSTDMHCVWL